MSGLDINRFIDLNDSLAIHLKCSICTDIFNKPVETQCRHTFCENCIKKWFETNQQKECPICRQKLINSNFQTNRLINEIINDLKVKCESKDCNTIVSFGSLTKHLAECEFKTCLKCGFLMGNIYQHNCLELTRSKLTQSEVLTTQLQEELKNVKCQLEKIKKEYKLEKSKLINENNCLKNENAQLRAPLSQMVGKRSFYVPNEVDPKNDKYFEVLDINRFKFIKVDNLFVKIELCKLNSSLIEETTTKFTYCLKNCHSFKFLRDALMKKMNSNEKYELKTENGHLIQDYETPLTLKMSESVKIQFFTPIVPNALAPIAANPMVNVLVNALNVNRCPSPFYQ